jgi:mono/diheme cytochrome c family protein
MRRVPLLGVVLLLLACGGEQTQPPATPPPTPPPTPEQAAEAEPPVVPAPSAEKPPAAEPALDVPEGNLRGDPVRGSTLYGQYCAMCHGATGKGDGPAGMALKPRPADHSDPVYMRSLSDARVYVAIEKGGVAVGKSPLMAPWGAVLKEQDMRDLVGFIRQLSGT